MIPKCVGAGGSDTTEEEITSPDSSTDNTDYNTEEEIVEEEKESGGSGVYGGCPLKEVKNGEWTDPYGSSTYWILECKTGYSLTFTRSLLSLQFLNHRSLFTGTIAKAIYGKKNFVD